MEENQKQYELIFILSPQLDGAELDKTKKEISDALGNLNGTISFKESQKRNLAYPINKQNEGIFLISQVSIPPENLTNLTKQLKPNKQILRHLVSQLEIPKMKPEKPRRIAKKTEKPVVSIQAKQSTTPSTKAFNGLEEIDKKLDELIDKI